MSDGPQPSGALTRRNVLLGAIGAVSAAAASALGGADRVFAGTSSDGRVVVVGGQYPIVQTTTYLQNSTTDRSLLKLKLANAKGDRAALDATATGGPGLSGRSTSNAGVLGASLNSAGVVGHSDRSSGVFGSAGRSAASDSHVANGVVGHTSLMNGRGVFGWNRAETGGTGVWGQADSPTGVGVRGAAWDGASAGGTFGTGVFGVAGFHDLLQPVPRAETGVMGVANAGVGVFGLGQTEAGRGGVFGGGAAQIRLLPSTAAEPPQTGLRGDLFLDQSCRLWLCRGDLGWTRIG